MNNSSITHLGNIEVNPVIFCPFWHFSFIVLMEMTNTVYDEADFVASLNYRFGSKLFAVIVRKVNLILVSVTT